MQVREGCQFPQGRWQCAREFAAMCFAAEQAKGAQPCEHAQRGRDRSRDLFVWLPGVRTQEQGVEPCELSQRERDGAAQLVSRQGHRDEARMVAQRGWDGARKALVEAIEKMTIFLAAPARVVLELRGAHCGCKSKQNDHNVEITVVVGDLEIQQDSGAIDQRGPRALRRQEQNDHGGGRSEWRGRMCGLGPQVTEIFCDANRLCDLRARSGELLILGGEMFSSLHSTRFSVTS